MKKFRIGLLFLLMALSLPALGEEVSVQVAATKEEAPPGAKQRDGHISLTLDDVQIVDVVRMFTMIAGINLIHNPTEERFSNRVTVRLEDKHWKPSLRAILVQNGLLLVEQHSPKDTYSIIAADSPAAAAQHVASGELIEFAQSVLKDLDAGKADSAKTRLRAFIKKEKTRMEDVSVEAKKKSKSFPKGDAPPGMMTREELDRLRKQREAK